MHFSEEMLWSLYHVQQYYNNIHFADLFRCWKNLPLPHRKYFYSHLHFPQNTLPLPQVAHQLHDNHPHLRTHPDVLPPLPRLEILYLPFPLYQKPLSLLITVKAAATTTYNQEIYNYNLSNLTDHGF